MVSVGTLTSIDAFSRMCKAQPNKRQRALQKQPPGLSLNDWMIELQRSSMAICNDVVDARC